MKRALSLFLCAIMVLAVIPLTASAATVTLTMAKTTLAYGEELTFSFTGTDTKDWVGIYVRGVTPDTTYKMWQYSESPGTLVFPRDNKTSLTALEPGLYTAHLLDNNGYTSIASVNFTVSPKQVAPLSLMMPNINGRTDAADYPGTQYTYTLGAGTDDAVNVTASYIPVAMSQRPSATSTGTITPQAQKFLVIHNTGNYAAGAAASNHWSWLTTSNDTLQSYHYVVGSDGIYQLLPENERAMHTGPDLTGNGCDNSNSIGMEICVNGFPATASSSGEKWNSVEMYKWYADYFAKRVGYAAMLAASICVRNNFNPYTQVVMHNYTYKKDCPMQMRYVFGKTTAAGGRAGSAAEDLTIYDGSEGTYWKIFKEKLYMYYEALGGTYKSTDTVMNTASASTSPAKYFPGTYKITGASGSNMRNMASSSATGTQVLINVPKDTYVSVTQVSTNNWGYTTYGGQSGWISLIGNTQCTSNYKLGSYNVIGSGAPMRASASSTAALSSTIPVGASFTVTQVENIVWGYTTYGGTSGWVALSELGKETDYSTGTYGVTGGTKVYSAANTSSSVLYTFTQSTAVSVYEKSGAKWGKITYDGGIGWIDLSTAVFHTDALTGAYKVTASAGLPLYSSTALTSALTTVPVNRTLIATDVTVISGTAYGKATYGSYTGWFKISGCSAVGKEYYSNVETPFLSPSTLHNSAHSFSGSLSAVTNDTFQLKGWFIHTEAVKKFQYSVNSGAWNTLTSVSRPDVQNAFGENIQTITTKAQYTTTSTINMRNMDSSTAAGTQILQTLPSGAVFEVDEITSNNWAKTTYNGHTGYVSLNTQYTVCTRQAGTTTVTTPSVYTDFSNCGFSQQISFIGMTENTVLKVRALTKSNRYIDFATLTLAITFDFKAVANSGVTIDTNNSVVTGINTSTSIAALANNFKCPIQVFDKTGTSLAASTDFVTTGCRIKGKNASNVEVTVEVVIKGDVLGHGRVTSSDYLQVKMAFRGKTVLSGCYFKAADANDDNRLSATDYLIIKRKLVS